MKGPNGNSLAIIGLTIAIGMAFSFTIEAQSKKPKFRALVLTERGGQHGALVDAAMKWLDELAVNNNFAIDVFDTTDMIDDAFLARYKVFIQLNYPPYTWKEKPMAAFRRYIEEGKGGGWIGFHHATLLGEFDGYPMWDWFSGFMGGIRFKGYIASLVSANVIVEDKKHPVMKGMPDSFTVTNEEWYTYDKSPRENVHVLAHVDESSYQPASDIRMGDHPVVWTNEKMKARNIYIFMGHHPDLLKNEAYKTLVRNSIFWAAGQ
jgi:uncharacterized protein